MAKQNNKNGVTICGLYLLLISLSDFQHSVRMAWSHLLSDSADYGDIRWWERILQQLLWERTTLLAIRKYLGVVA